MQDPLAIDHNNLHLELLRQPGMSRDAGNKEADARYEMDRAKARLAVLGARLALAIRKDPGRYDLRDKPNKEEIEAAVLVQKEYQAEVEKVADAVYAHETATAYSRAMIDRRKALERLVELLALDYYAEREPRVDRKGREKMDDRLLERERDGGVTDF